MAEWAKKNKTQRVCVYVEWGKWIKIYSRPIKNKTQRVCVLVEWEHSLNKKIKVNLEFFWNFGHDQLLNNQKK